MTSLLSPFLFYGLAIVVLLAFLSRIIELKRSFYLGVMVWSKWTPFFAVIVYLIVLGSYFLPFGTVRSLISVSSYLSKIEILTFLLIAIFFMSSLGNLVSSAALIYLTFRFSSISPSNAPMSIYLLLGSTTVVALLADKLPWNQPDGTVSYAKRMRQLILFVLSFGFISMSILAIARIHILVPWLENHLKISASEFSLIALMLLTAVGWISISIGQTRHFTMLILAIPSLIILAFITSWPSYFLFIPFVACLALSLATADRRLANRRQSTR